MSRLLLGFFLSLVLNIGLTWATTMLPGGLTLEEVGEAPWIFLGEVVSTEIVADGKTPATVPTKWQARYTRFRVIQAVKGPFHKGYEVELKECGPRHLPSQPFCGGLYPRSPDYNVGDVFFVVTGPENKNVHDYQTSIRFPANRVPVAPRIKLFPSQPEGSASMSMQEGMQSLPMSESGWLIDLSRLSINQETTLGPAEKSGRAKAKGFAAESEAPPLLSPGSKLVDLNRLSERLGGMGK
jgi:hypothetical protein